MVDRDIGDIYRHMSNIHVAYVVSEDHSVALEWPLLMAEHHSSIGSGFPDANDLPIACVNDRDGTFSRHWEIC